MYTYVFTPSALKDTKKLPKDIQKKILEKLDYFIASGQPLSFAHHLINYDLGEYRYRIGDYRVVFDLDDETLVILAVGHRREIYK